MFKGATSTKSTDYAIRQIKLTPLILVKLYTSETSMKNYSS